MFSGLPRFSWRHSVRFGAVVALALSVAGCDKAQLLAPTNSTISVSAAARTLALGGSTEVSATVIESAGTQVQDGTTVRFSTSLGRVDPVEAQTHHGVATTTFFAGDTSGVAEVRATSGGAGSGTSSSGGTTTTTTTAANAVQITIGAANTNTVAVSASPSTVPASGGTVTITGQALDANGNRLVNVPITFSTTAGTLSSSVATTNANGEAIVTLTSDRAATVTAAAGGKTATVAITQAAANSVALSLAPNPGTVGSPVTATITPTIGANNTPPHVIINWGDGGDQDLGTVAAARTTSHVYTAAGNYTVSVAAMTGSDTFTTSATEAVNNAAGPTITASSSTVAHGTALTFTVTPPTGSSATDVVIDFGDGSTLHLGAITGATSVSHVFNDVNTFTVRATQTNANGSTGTGVVVVTVT